MQLTWLQNVWVIFVEMLRNNINFKGTIEVSFLKIKCL